MNILHIQQDLEGAWVSKQARVLNITRLYMQGLLRVPNMSGYGSIPLSNA